MLIMIALLLGLVFAVLYPVVPWSAILGSPPRAEAEVSRSIAVLFGCFLIGLPLTVAERVQAGYQEGYINGLWRRV